MRRRDDFLKFTAMLTMLIDHIGYLLMPSLIWMRIIGRLSFPIFAFLIARGYRHTSSVRTYALRLFALGLISQIPYALFVPGKWNIMFTLLLGLAAIRAYDSNWRPVAFFLPLIGHFFPVSYGVYGIAMILAFHLSYGSPDKIVLSYGVLSTLHFLATGNTIQSLSIFALFFILLEPPVPIRVPKAVGYLFYPGHIAVLLLVDKLM